MEMNTTTETYTYETLPQDYITAVEQAGYWTEEYSTAQLMEFCQQMAIYIEHWTMTYNDEAWGNWAMDTIKQLNLDAMQNCIHKLSRIIALRIAYNYEPKAVKATA